MEVEPADRVCPHCRRDTADQNLPTQLAVGSVLRGRHATYRIGQAIGCGGFGQTYLALDLATHGFVAIKEYYPRRCNLQRLQDGSVQPAVSMGEAYREGMKSFIREATMLSALMNIESIVHVTDYFEDLGTAYMVMDYVVGRTLKSCVQEFGAMSFEALREPAIALMHDVDTINGAGVVHRDINPANVILTPEGRLRLIDFGCARSMEDGRSMEVMLTPGFAPTEQYSRHGQGPYTDVYALCATLYYCLCAEVPPSSSDRANAVFQGVRDPLMRPSELGVRLPDGVEDALMHGLAIFPRDRTQTMGELAAALEGLAQGRWPNMAAAASSARTVAPRSQEMAGMTSAPASPEPSAPPEVADVPWYVDRGTRILLALALVAVVALTVSITMCAMG